MESNHRFYLRRAAEETARAAKAVTPASHQWHDKLAKDFSARAREFAQSPREGIADRRWPAKSGIAKRHAGCRA